MKSPNGLDKISRTHLCVGVVAPQNGLWAWVHPKMAYPDLEENAQQ